MDLLLEALLSEEPRAREAWAAWRAKIDIDTVPYSEQQLFPALSPAFPDWLEKDPAEAIFNGIVRKVWSQNQLRLQTAVELDALFQQAGVPALVAGPLAWAMKIPRPAIRPIPHLSFLVPREQAGRACEALTGSGWELSLDFPPDQWLDRRGGYVRVHKGNLYVNLHWRLLQVPPEDARGCERAFLSTAECIHWNRHTLRTVSREATLLDILCGERDGDFPWEADVALVGTAGIDWASFLELARRFAPLAIVRIGELRRYSRLAIPPLPSDNPGVLRKTVRRAWRRYRANSYYRKKALSWPGFAEFLASAAARKLVQAVPVRYPRKRA